MAGFGEKLSAELQARGLGARTLARMLDPTNVENEQRAVRRYLKGKHTPRSRRREQIEAALGLERGALEADDEEESLAAVLLSEVRSTRGWTEYDPALARLRALATVGSPEGQLRDAIIGFAAAKAVGQFFYFGGRLSERDGSGDNLRGASPAFPSRSESRAVAA